MNISILIFESIDDDANTLFVKRKNFTSDSEEVIKAMIAEEKILRFARLQGYKIMCEGKVLCDYTENDIYDLIEEQKKLLVISKVNSSPSYTGEESMHQIAREYDDAYMNISRDLKTKKRVRKI